MHGVWVQLMIPREMLIEMGNVCIERGKIRILDNVSLSIPQHEHVAILGPNGSGKSTLLKLLMKINYPSVVDGMSGRVSILGREDWNVWDLRSNLGFVSSETDHHFLSGRSGRLSALQSVLTGYFSSELEPDFNSVSDAMRQEAIRLLLLFGMRNDSSKSIGNMSTGERRRLLLARALVAKPLAIVLDEPTSGLDILARAKLLSELEMLAASGVQIILVTHHLEEILPCIKRIILLKEGKVFLDRATEEALSEDSVSSLFDAKIKIDCNEHGYYSSRLST